MNNIVFFDLDNTLIKGYSQKLFLSYIRKKQKVGKFFVFYVYFWFVLYGIKLVNSPRRIMEKAFLFIKNWKVLELENIIKGFVDDVLVLRLNEKIVDKLNEHINNNDEIYIVSNSPLPIVKAVGVVLGIKNIIATKLEIVNGVYTGRIHGDIVYGENKIKEVNPIIMRKEGFCKTFFYSDHYSDLPLFNMVDVKIAVYPDKMLEKVAKKNNWLIIK